MHSRRSVIAHLFGPYAEHLGSLLWHFRTFSSMSTSAELEAGSTMLAPDMGKLASLRIPQEAVKELHAIIGQSILYVLPLQAGH